jgi:hypothetical protein
VESGRDLDLCGCTSELRLAMIKMSDLLQWAPLIGPILAALVVIIGWGISHSLTSRRDLYAEKRKIRINFMIDAIENLKTVPAEELTKRNTQMSFILR